MKMKKRFNKDWQNLLNYWELNNFDTEIFKNKSI